jgi:hypothetical protein
MKVRKIDAIKCIRDSVPGLGLREGKEICECLPFEIEVRSEYVPYLENVFEFEVTTTVKEETLQAKWDALPLEKRLRLLQILDADHRLD